MVGALEALHEKMKHFRLQIFLAKTKVHVFGGLLDEAVQSSHSCDKNIEISEDFTVNNEDRV